jgi:8-oxo-dGTP pyrophosphatase MutT (NUDIX family)
LITIDDIAAGLAGRSPERVDPGTEGDAAVAVILHEAAGDTRLLIIERARHDGDPWSGDLAFPGGRIDPGDADEQAAATRETFEEVGLDLSGARFLGRLDDRPARILPMTISAFVYAVSDAPDLTLSDEVFDAFWVPVAHLLDDTRHCRHELQNDSDLRRFPAIDLLGPGKPLLWGVTYFFLCALLRDVGHELPSSAPA